MSRIDIRNSAIIGFFIALLLVIIQSSGNIPHLSKIPLLQTSRFIFPILAISGLYVASLLSKKLPVLLQGTKFLLVGTLNTLLDLGVLNILIAASGNPSGIGFSSFKAISFIAAIVNSYFWNKFWTFRSTASLQQDFNAKRKEFIQFFSIGGIGFLLNVGSASFVVNVVKPQFDISPTTWATVAALIGTFIVLTWNFLGYKLIVFKR